MNTLSNILEFGFFVGQKFGILVSTGRPEKVSQFPFDECIKKARVFPLSQRFQTRDRRKLTYSKELIIGARPPLACFSPSAFSYCNSGCYGVFKSGIIHDSDFDRCKKIIKEFQRAISRDKWIKKAHMFPLSLRFQTRDRRKLTYSKELIIGARPPLACFSPSNFSYCNSVCYGVFKSVTKYS